jgi:toxin ParE1/3/4
MMPGFQVLPRAEADIETIVAYIHADSPAAARRWLDKLYERFRKLGAMPGQGVLRPEVAPDMRLLPFGNYVILYREDAYGAQIVRVMHAKRDPDSWLS